MADPDQPSIIETINTKIPVARGWYCETNAQLLEAYRRLGIRDVVIKPVYGAAGAACAYWLAQQH
jgi:biotin carboxylase